MLQYIKMVRPVNLLILAVTQYLVLFFLIRPIMLLNGSDIITSQFDFALFVLSNVLLAAAGYAINDFYDTRIDTINKPDKNVLLHGVPAKNAEILCYVLNAIACLLGFYCGWRVGFFKLGFLPLVVALALYFYALKYKRQFLVGNIVVSLVIAYSILVVWLFQFFAIKTNPAVFAAMMNNFMVISYFVIGFAVFAFFITLIREIIKDIEDIEGDRADGCNTAPIKLGIPKTKKIILGLIIFNILLLAFAQILLYTDYTLTSWYLLVVQFMYVFLIIKLMKAKEKADFHFVNVFAKIIMIAGLLATQLLYITF
jgi:4-hydroxybenzoate polyprenyltransferase